MMTSFLQALLLGSAGATALAIILTMLPRAGRTGRWLSDRCAKAPGLDLTIALLTWLPWLVAGVWSGWFAVLGCIIGQMLALLAWIAGHEMAHAQQRRGPRIVRFINRSVGPWRNHLALWFTLIGLPVLWLIRLTEIIAYPLLVWLLNFPRYRHGEWVNVSRHKFSGLIGHDLIWCLYCDWMTGVYALGGEMLRNVESFWCPIRFYEGKKCENCRIDFPDIDHGWVAADGTMADVEQVLETMYPADRPRTWFGHPARLTISGTSTDQSHARGASGPRP